MNKKQMAFITLMLLMVMSMFIQELASLMAAAFLASIVAIAGAFIIFIFAIAYYQLGGYDVDEAIEKILRVFHIFRH